MGQAVTTRLILDAMLDAERRQKLPASSLLFCTSCDTGSVSGSLVDHPNLTMMLIGVRSLAPEKISVIEANVHELRENFRNGDFDTLQAQNANKQN